MIPRVHRTLDAVLIVIALMTVLATGSPASAARLATPRWANLTALSANIPGDRSHHSMVMDPDRNRVIMWSGHNDEHQLLDPESVWVFDLCTMQWSEMPTAGIRPAPRHGHSAVMLPEQNKMIVLFGSTNADHDAFLQAHDATNEVWQLDLNETPFEWSPVEIAGTGPAPCKRWHSAAVTYGPITSNSSEVYVFGGRTTADTDPINPPHYAPFAVNDTWLLKQTAGNTWDWFNRGGLDCTLIPEGGGDFPDRRYKHSLIVGRGAPGPAAEEKLYFHGGIYFEDINTSNAFRGRIVTSPPSVDWGTTDYSTVTGQDPARAEHTAIFDPVGYRMIIFGGHRPLPNIHGEAPVAQLWAMSIVETCPGSNGLDMGCWTQLNPTGGTPAPIKGHAAVYDPTGDRMIMFGGQLGSGQTSAETWQLAFSDIVPAVTSLGVQSYSSPSVTLSWSSPMPIGNPPLLCPWDLRTSASPINSDQAFESATRIISPVSRVGTTYSTTFNVANPSSVRYYALRYSIPSSISNVLCFRLSPYMPCMEELRTDLEGPPPAPTRLSLSVPNPVGRSFECSITAPDADAAVLSVHDVAGRSVERHELPAGTRSRVVRIGEAASLRPGFYMVVLRQGANESRKSVIVR